MTQILQYLMLPLVHVVVALIAILTFIALNGLILVYVERKVAGFIQRRPGPFEVGPHGLLQPMADALKLVAKQLVAPKEADRILFWVAPLLSFTPVAICLMPIPFGPYLTGWNVNLGILLVLAFSGLNVLALCLAGWSSNNKYSLLGAARAVAQSVAYEIPLLLSVLCIAFTSGSLNFADVTASQSGGIFSWNVFVQPLAFLIFFIAALAETNRAPFDLPEAESELTAGFHTEYSGMGFGLFFLAEYSYMIVVSAVGSVLFLGGWNAPFRSGHWWMLGKIYALILVMMWFRWTYPRVRFDQLLNVCWKWLIPLSLVNLLGTALIINLVR